MFFPKATGKNGKGILELDSSTKTDEMCQSSRLLIRYG